MRIATLGRWVAIVLAGLLAGLVGAAVLTSVQAAMRYWLGISPPQEMIPDRLAPTLSINDFFALFGEYGGYNGLKRFGIRSGLMGVAVAGTLVGALYALVVESRRSRASRRWPLGTTEVGGLFVLGALAVLWAGSLLFLAPTLDTNFRGLPPRQAEAATAVGYLVAFASYALTMVTVYRFVAPRRGPVAARGDGALEPPAGGPDALALGRPLPRRAIVAAAAGVAAAAPAWALVRRLNEKATFSYDGTVYSNSDGRGLQGITPTERFYTVTKNVVDPEVNTGVWRLVVDGKVDDPRQYDYEGLRALPAIDQESTLMCISNRISAGLFSNAVWSGTPLRDILLDAGVADDAYEVVLRGADGYTDTFGMDKALDPTTLVVWGMNGEPLPRIHGGPVRVIVPGLYGEKNMKWVTGIEVVDHDVKGFYEQQGWGPDFVIPTRSDFFEPRVRSEDGRFVFADRFQVGRAVTLKGRAFAGDRGVSKVEVSTDGGESWQPTAVAYLGTRLTWRHWTLRWVPREAGDREFVVRAYDGNGDLQPTESVGTVPQGARGLHRVLARIDG